MTSTSGDLALVMGGGGARAAYQAGVLRALARRLPELETPILTGVSAGAINVVHLANHTGTFSESVEELVHSWRLLDISKVFDAKALSLVWRVLRVGLRLTFGLPPGVPLVHGMVDTRPLRRFLHEVLHAQKGSLPGIAKNLASGKLKAVALTTTCYATGQTITFFSGREITAWKRPQRVSVNTPLTVDHLMASAALPLFFPSVRIGDAWYGDGGIRLVAPIAPALHLGADRILAISTGCARTTEETCRPTFGGPPSPVQVMGVLYDAIFLDQLDQDALQLQRINQLLRELPDLKRRGLREVKLLVVRPSRDLGELANEFEFQLPWMFRYLTRQLGTKKAKTQDFLSTVMFESQYLSRILELGERDGEARADEIADFVRS